MKKLLGIIVLGLLLSGNAYAETVLRCEIDPEWNSERVTVEINLKKKILFMNGYSYDIETIGDRAIVAKKENKIIKLDRYDGYIKLIGFLTSSGSKEFDGYCKKFNKIF
ncbi:hypothetical protein N9O46_00155 [Candidatus Pelagibacter ubique]|nr:hypothetical protein [Candidatus Pelagibacter ubique]